MPVSRRDVLHAGVGLAAGGAVWAAEEPAMADLILHNARVTTLGANGKDASAVAIRDGRIAAVGADREVLKAKTGSTRVFDLDGRASFPA